MPKGKGRRPDVAARNKARAQATKAAKPQPEKMVELNLTIAHSLNGQPYGPGRVTVRKAIARTLMEQEQRFREGEERFHAQDRAFLIGAGPNGNVKIPVPYDTFNESWQNPHVLYGVAGSGNFRNVR